MPAKWPKSVDRNLHKVIVSFLHLDLGHCPRAQSFYIKRYIIYYEDMKSWGLLKSQTFAILGRLIYMYGESMIHALCT